MIVLIVMALIVIILLLADGKSRCNGGSCMGEKPTTLPPDLHRPLDDLGDNPPENTGSGVPEK